MQGWMKCTNLLSKPITEFWGSIKCTKLVIDEMYEIGWSIAKFEYEYSRICIISVVTAFLFVVKPTLMTFFGCSSCVSMFGCLACMKILMLSFIKLGCLHCRWGMKENILIFCSLRCAWYTWNLLCHQP